MNHNHGHIRSRPSHMFLRVQHKRPKDCWDRLVGSANAFSARGSSIHAIHPSIHPTYIHHQSIVHPSIHCYLGPQAISRALVERRPWPRGLETQTDPVSIGPRKQHLLDVFNFHRHTRNERGMASGSTCDDNCKFKLDNWTTNKRSHTQRHPRLCMCSLVAD